MFLLRPSRRFEFSDEELTKALTSLAIETSVSRTGNQRLEIFENRLLEKYRCYFADCLEHPDYLVSVLHQVYPDNDDVLKSIIMELDNSSNIEEITKFVSYLKRHVK